VIVTTARWIVATLAVGVVALVIVFLPPAAIESPAPATTPSQPVVKGAYHIHSSRSDGTGTIDEIARAAARAGLQFVIVTDHGDGTRAPEPPSYRAGVLCVDSVEVSTSEGHVVALGLPQMPYRLAGRARDVIEDVQRFGGVAIAAHPGSPKPALQWTDWEAPFDGLEWLNTDSEWRDEMWGSLGRVLLTYPWRPAETLASLLDRPVEELARWDRATRTRHVVGIAGADAHARLGLRSTSEPYDDRVIARVPSYEASFRAFVNHAVLDTAFSGDPIRDARQLLDAIRQGRVVTSVDGLARLAGFDVQALGGGRTARIGESIDSRAGVAFKVSIGAPAGTRIVLLRDGSPMHEVVANEMITMVGADAGVYRFEAHLPPAISALSIPWVVTNPIYVNMALAHRPRRHEPIDTNGRMYMPTDDWQAEASAGSESVLTHGALAGGTTPGVLWKLRVAAGASPSPYAAIRFPTPPQLASHRGIQLRVQSDRPMRIWAQLRAPGGGERRWVHSLYIDERQRLVELPFDRFAPATDTVAPGAPALDEIDSLLLVADTVNTMPGTAASVAIAELSLVKP